MYKDSKWAKEILTLQENNGLWGYFHTLSEPSKHPITTEQALRRLRILGYTYEDAPIQRALSTMSDCLAGKMQMPDRAEKTHDWKLFTNLMLATWMRKFTLDDPYANQVAADWAMVLSYAFSQGEYDGKKYAYAYQHAFGIQHKGDRLVDFANFYQVSLVADQLDLDTENCVFDYLLQYSKGIYYVYGDAPLAVLPKEFASKRASHYLAAIELLTAYKNNTSKLSFVANWLEDNRQEDGLWDMGSSVKDHIYFPLQDSWRIKELRVADCTDRIQRLLQRFA